MSESELLHLLALQRVPNLGDASAKKLIGRLGSAETVFKAKKRDLLKIDGIGLHKLKGLHLDTHLKAAEEELRYITDNGIRCTGFNDPDYPEKLRHCIDGPILFFHRGNIDLKGKKILSIVGTRKLTNYGRRFCEKLVEELSPLDPIIVSGFAYGADITAQLAAVKNGLQTIGCLAHGLNLMYPEVHQKYAADVEANGGFISEFWSSDPFDRTNFLQRNRIIAGLSEATVVIESAERGGSLVTADIAQSYNRDVFALPGRAGDIQSTGCNNLIKAQKAHLLTSAADIAYLLNWEVGEPKPRAVQKQLFAELDADELRVFDFLSENKKEALDLIALQCGFPTHQAASLLLGMELKGIVRPLPGKVFELA